MALALEGEFDGDEYLPTLVWQLCNFETKKSFLGSKTRTDSTFQKLVCFLLSRSVTSGHKRGAATEHLDI